MPDDSAGGQESRGAGFRSTGFNLTSMARREPAGDLRPGQVVAKPTATQEPAHRLVFLPPDWLPLALIAGDAVIVVVSILGSYWYYVNLDPLRRSAGQLAF